MRTHGHPYSISIVISWIFQRRREKEWGD